MAWRMSVTGIPLGVQLLIDDDQAALAATNPARAENVLALAEVAAYMVFRRLGVAWEQRQAYREDAEQEAAATILEYAHRGPCCAYGLAKKRQIHWVVEQLWQGKRRTAKDRREGRRTLLPLGPSLDAFEREPLFIGQGRTRTPEEILVARDEEDTRGAAIQEFFDVVYDIVACKMGLERRQHYTALNDAAVFELTLTGNTIPGIARELGCAERLAEQRVCYARARLGAFLAKQGLDTVAGWYTGVAAGAVALTDVRAQQGFIAAYLAEQEAVQGLAAAAGPARRKREQWKRDARQRWARPGRGAVSRVAVAAD